VRPGRRGGVHAGEDAQAPAEDDDDPAAAVAEGLGQRDVGDDTDAEQDQDGGAENFTAEDGPQTDGVHVEALLERGPQRCGPWMS
jgi:hypothetical protein